MNFYCEYFTTTRNFNGKITLSFSRTLTSVVLLCVLCILPYKIGLFRDELCMLSHFSHIQLFTTLWTIATSPQIIGRLLNKQKQNSNVGISPTLKDKQNINLANRKEEEGVSEPLRAMLWQ